MGRVLIRHMGASDMTMGASEGAEPEGPAPPRRKAPPSPPAKAGRAFADKARDLDALRTTVVDAAGVGAGLWFSYLFVLLYLFVAVGSVTHKDLFLKSPIRLPFLNIELPLLGFFALGPLLFLVVHGYVLLHFVLLAGKVGAFHTELKQLDAPPEMHEELRWQLPSNLFVQILAGPREVRSGVVGVLLRLVAWFSLALGPVALLAFFLLQFLPYHHEWITWWHRIALVVDLALLWLLWISVARGRAVRPRALRGLAAASMAAASLFLVVSAFTVATFPGERLYAWQGYCEVSTDGCEKAHGAWASLHRWLMDGAIDHEARASRSLWSNRIVLPGLDVIDRAKRDMTANAAALPETISLRRRDLRGAVLTGATLGKADLTAAQLQGAVLDDVQLQGAALGRAQLQGASLKRAQLQGASLLGAGLQGASLDRTQLQGASLVQAHLQGAYLVDARLQGALLDGAELHGAQLDFGYLQGASLLGTRLRGVSLFGARLQGAVLDRAQLQGAGLTGAQLQGASLDRAQLQGASLDQAQLQGASLDLAELQGASLDRAQLQGASLTGAQLQGASLDRAQLQGASLDRAQLQGASLDRAQLQGASLIAVQLQGASLAGAQLQGASLEGSAIWRSDPRMAGTGRMRVVQTDGRALSAKDFEELRRSIRETTAAEPEASHAFRQIEALNPDETSGEQEAMKKAWADLEASPPPVDAVMASIADAWRQVGCDASGSPHVLRRLTARFVNRILPPMPWARSEDEIALRDKHLAALTVDFLKDDCAGTRGLNEYEKAVLRNRPWERAPMLP